MQRVDRGDAQVPRRQTSVETALGAVTVDDIGADRAGVGNRLAGAGQVAETGQPRDRNARHPEAAMGCNGFEQARGGFAAGTRVAENANRMAAPRLAAGQIAHMAEKAADGRAENMQDAHRSNQNQRSRT